MKYEVDGVRVIVDQIAADVIENAGGVTIYSTSFGPKAKLEISCSGS
ncbi:MAG: hypothetical protein WBG50_24320 [Desulfomonilaceae bacterium]